MHNLAALASAMAGLSAHRVSLPLGDPITQGIINDALNSLTSWVESGATWVLHQIVDIVGQKTAIDLSAPWFKTHFNIMASLALMVMLPVLMIAAVRGAFSANPTSSVAAAFAYLPLAIFGTAAAIPIVNLVLKIVDNASMAMSTTLDADYHAFVTNLGNALTGGATPILNPFIAFICAIFMVLFGLLVLVELVFRNAAIYATAIFIPLAMATMVFPGATRMAKHMIEILVGFILLKFFIVAVLAVGVGAVSHGFQGQSPFITVITGVVILILVCVLPNVLIAFFPVIETAAMDAMVDRVTTHASRAAAQHVSPKSSKQIYAEIRRQNEAAGLYAAGGGAAAGAGGAKHLLGRSAPRGAPRNGGPVVQISTGAGPGAITTANSRKRASGLFGSAHDLGASAATGARSGTSAHPPTNVKRPQEPPWGGQPR